MDEAFDCWSHGKNPYDYSVVFKDWWQRDIDAMVLRDRNHPSVVMWSIGNEIPERGEPLGAQEAKMLADYLRGLDRTRPVTSALNFVAQVDRHRRVLCSARYRRLQLQSEQPRGGPQARAVEDHGLHGVVPASHVRRLGHGGRLPVHRREFRLDRHRLPRRVGPRTVRLCAMRRTPAGRAMALPSPGTAPTAAISTSADTAGPSRITATSCGTAARSSTWASGSPCPKASRCPSRGGASGRFTRVGPGPAWRASRSKWRSIPGARRCASTWTTSCIGEKPTTRAEKFKANFSVPYAPGVLKAVALQGGKAIAETVLRTAGEPAQIRLTADRTSLRADGQDLSFITVEALDANGQPHPNAEHQVTFASQGPWGHRGGGERRPDERGAVPGQSAQAVSREGARRGPNLTNGRRPHPYRHCSRTQGGHPDYQDRACESVADPRRVIRPQ